MNDTRSIRPRLVGALILTALLLVFVLQNTHVVSIRFLFWTFSMSQVILILICAALGFGAGFLVARATRRA